MPPKAKIVRDEGIEKLTSRNLGKKLGSSACPIFTVFSGMEDVEAAMLEAAKAIYKGYVEVGLARELPFRGVGEQYIRFAANEPKLFQLLFMSETKEAAHPDCILPLLDESYDKILRSLMLSSSIDRQTAEKLYRHLWVYTHGIACLCATKTCQFSEKETQRMLTEVFRSLLKNMGTSHE